MSPPFCVIDANAWAGSDPARGNLFAFFDPNLIAEQVGAVELAIDPERDAEFARAVGEILIGLIVSASAHHVDSFNWFESANEHGVGDIGDVRYDVELVIHAIDEIDVRRAADLVHRFGAVGAATTISV